MPDPLRLRLVAYDVYAASLTLSDPPSKDAADLAGAEVSSYTVPVDTRLLGATTAPEDDAAATLEELWPELCERAAAVARYGADQGRAIAATPDRALLISAGIYPSSFLSTDSDEPDLGPSWIAGPRPLMWLAADQSDLMWILQRLDPRASFPP